jgi:hypothetical protein
MFKWFKWMTRYDGLKFLSLSGDMDDMRWWLAILFGEIHAPVKPWNFESAVGSWMISASW